MRDGRARFLGIIAARQNISENYLEQVFSILRKAGLVKSVKGAQGGYILARQPSKIKVGDILRALEEALTLSTMPRRITLILSVSKTVLGECLG